MIPLQGSIAQVLFIGGNMEKKEILEILEMYLKKSEQYNNDCKFHLASGCLTGAVKTILEIEGVYKR